MTIQVGRDIGSYVFDASAKTITISGLGTLNINVFRLITNAKDQIQIFNWQGPASAVGGSLSGNVLTLNYDATGMEDADDLDIILEFGEPALDFDLSALKVLIQNMISEQYTDSELLVAASDIGATDDVWIDQGSEIDCRTYKTIGIYIDLTVNDSTGNQLQVLSKRENAGSDEYVLESSADYQKTLGDVSTKIAYFFNVESIAYIQIQTKATDVDTGGGTEGTVDIDIIKEY